MMRAEAALGRPGLFNNGDNSHRSTPPGDWPRVIGAITMRFAHILPPILVGLNMNFYGVRILILGPRARCAHCELGKGPSLKLHPCIIHAKLLKCKYVRSF